jgi:transposase-like protein
MLAKPKAPRIPLPKGWQGCVKSAVLHAIALAHYAIVHARAWAADSINARVRLAAENDRLQAECALLREELRIKDARTAQITPQRRPHYPVHERMAILELRAARAWSLKQTADTFLVTPATIASWLKRIDEQGTDALLQLCQPVNKFPDFSGG